MRRVGRFLVVMGLLALASAGPAMAALVGTNVRLSGGSATSDDATPAVASGPGGYLVVWEDWRDLGTRSADIYGQLIGADGALLGTNFRISGTSATDLSPAVAWNDTAAEYLVVWQDWRDYGTRGQDTYGQRVAADGSLEGTNFRISNGDDDEYSPAVAWNETANQYLVIWQDYRDYDTRGPDIYGQRLGGNGGLIGGNIRISSAAGTPTPTSKRWPALAWNGMANQFIVVWEDGRSNTADRAADRAADRGQDIYGQRLGGYGGLIGVNFRISGGSATADDSQPAIAWNGSANRYLVTWQDYRNLGGARLADIYGQRLGAYGGAIDLNFRISGADATFDDWYPGVSCSAAENQCLVAWQDHRSEGSRGWDIYGQRVSG
jgi:hypothetical protein